MKNGCKYSTDCKASVKNCVIDELNNDGCACKISFGCVGKNQLNIPTITDKNIHILKKHLGSIEDGGRKRLNFDTRGINTCGWLCDSTILQYGICNFEQESCEVRLKNNIKSSV